MGRVGRALTVVLLVLVLAGAAALAAWWWSLRAGTDPIDADPVSGYGIVVSSPSCAAMPAGARTVVTVVDVTPPIQAQLDACGYRQGQRLAIEYLDGSPQQARLAGTTTGGMPDDTLRKLLPVAILLAGLVAVGATFMLLRDRRRTESAAAPGRVTVAELQAALAATRATGAAGPASVSPPPAVPIAADPPADPPAVPVAADPSAPTPTAGPTPEPAGADLVQDSGPAGTPDPAEPPAAGDPSAGRSLFDTWPAPDPMQDTDPGRGDRRVVGSDRAAVLGHVVEQPLLTHGGTDEPSAQQ